MIPAKRKEFEADILSRVGRVVSGSETVRAAVDAFSKACRESNWTLAEECRVVAVGAFEGSLDGLAASWRVLNEAIPKGR